MAGFEKQHGSRENIDQVLAYLGGGATVANDAGMTATEKDLLSKIATAIQATSPASSIRNSVYAS